MVESDDLRIRALRAVKTLELPDWLIAAGFVRNLVWNNIYGRDIELNDIDVIYYCIFEVSECRDVAIEAQLRALEPELPWSVKNQARMHLQNGDSPYKSTLDAMGYWPEKQTAIGAKLDDDDRVVLHSKFGFELQFNGQINPNPARSLEIFERRVHSKCWLKSWPELRVQT